MRIVNVNIPDNKQIVISLTYIFGIGLTTSKSILSSLKIEPLTKTKDLTSAQVDQIRSFIQKSIIVEGNLREKRFASIKRLKENGSYSGFRHKKRLPQTGRTKTNARSFKGRKPAIGSRKKTRS